MPKYDFKNLCSVFDFSYGTIELCLKEGRPDRALHRCQEARRMINRLIIREKLPTDIKVIRLEQTEQGALGALILFDHYFCSTLEPDDQDPKRYQIPEGIYKCRRFHGAKFKDTYEILVKGHTAVLFHPGNRETDTLGCVLVGQYPGKLMGTRAVLNSSITFEKFMTLLQGRQAPTVEFINWI